MSWTSISWTSIGAVVASGLVMATVPLVGDSPPPDLTEFCTSDAIQAGDGGPVSLARVFISSGEVVQTDPGGRVLTVRHRDTTGALMTMMFQVKSGDLVENLWPNDRIRFKINGSNMTIVAIAPI
jgi:hypothetical protein